MLCATIVAPGHAMALPLMPEFIAPQDGAEKQDCERNAAKRWLATHADRVGDLRPIFLGDDLFACQPVPDAMVAAGGDFLLTAKPSSHKALYDFMDGATPEERVLKQKVAGRTLTHRYRWFSKVPLRDGEDARLVDPFRLYLDRRRHEGCRNTRRLWREIVTDSFKGSFATLARWAARLWGVGPADGAIVPASKPDAPRPSQRRCAWLLGCERDELTAAERAYIERLTAEESALPTISLLARSFAAMVRGGDASGLDDWIASAGDSDLSGLATGVLRDKAAVAAAITEP